MLIFYASFFRFISGGIYSAILLAPLNFPLSEVAIISQHICQSDKAGILG
jgi:hypothetical protein